MKYYLISIGGTGAKCLEAFVHMNAMGLMKSVGEIKIIYVDPDASNGNLAKAKDTVSVYQKAYTSAAQDKNFFTNRLLSEENTWNPVPGGSNASLRTIFERSAMEYKAENLDGLFDVLFSEEEQNTKLTEGFRAHPAIGAAVIGANMNMDEDNSVWKKMVNDIGEQEARIFFFGSVFGGTGAAGFPNIAKIIRKYFDDKEVNDNPDSKNTKKAERIKMAGCLMLPYFDFPKANEEDMIDPDDPSKKIIVPDSGKFLASTYAALNYYNKSNLVGDVFDAVYLLGDKQYVSMDKYKAGRREQKNKAHFLEMLAALSALEFFNKQSTDDCFKDPKCYMLALHGKDFSWEDLPPVAPEFKMKAKVQTFIRMTYMYRSLLFPKLKECKEDDSKFKDNPWIGGYLRGLSENKGFLGKLLGSGKEEPKITDENYDAIKAFEEYSIKFLDWLQDFTYSKNSAVLRCSKLINKIVYSYDDEKSYDENYKNGNALEPQNIFVEKGDTQLDNEGNSFFQKMENPDKESKGFKLLLARAYEISQDGKEVE